jgi:hypothetical protein
MIERSAKRLGGVVFLALLGACAPQKAPADTPEGETKLSEYEVARVPEAVEHRMYADFEGKVQLLGYEVSPDDLAPPGSKVSMKLYWQRTGRLAPGWGLFTHILDEQGRQLAQRDDSGPLREAGEDGAQKYGPSSWELGKTYEDAIEFEIPRDVTRGDERRPISAQTVTIAVGVWKGARSDDPGGAARLDVIGHPADMHRRALVAHLKTGIEPPKPKGEGDSSGSDNSDR